LVSVSADRDEVWRLKAFAVFGDLFLVTQPALDNTFDVHHLAMNLAALKRSGLFLFFI
jgi:hypothetical protein